MNNISIIVWARPYSKNRLLPADLPSHEATRRPSTLTITPQPVRAPRFDAADAQGVMSPGPRARE